MPRKEISLEIDETILEKLEAEAKEHGWTVEETIRVILGTAPQLNPPKAIMMGMPFPMPGQGQGKSPMADMEEVLAKYTAAMGSATCKNCTRKFTSDELKAGECSNCGEKI